MSNKYDKRELGEKYPFSFQQKIVLRFIKDKFSGKERASMLLIYFTISWIVSDFSNDKSEKTVNNWPRVIASYSGIGKGTAQKYVRKLTKLGFITYNQERNDKGRWNKRKIMLPEELPREVIGHEAENSKTEAGLTITEETDTL